MNMITYTEIPDENDIPMGYPKELEDRQRMTNFKIKTNLTTASTTLSSFSISEPKAPVEIPIEIVEKKNKSKGQNLF